jgi:hypothetical protein
MRAGASRVEDAGAPVNRERVGRGKEKLLTTGVRSPDHRLSILTNCARRPAGPGRKKNDGGGGGRRSHSTKLSLAAALVPVGCAADEWGGWRGDLVEERADEGELEEL